MSKEFRRQDHTRYSKLGRNRKKMIAWRRPKGRDSKIRERKFGYPTMPTVGHRTALKESGLIQGKVPYLVHNMNELEQINDKKAIVILASVGAKKRLELIKKAEAMKLPLANVPRNKEAKK